MIEAKSEGLCFDDILLVPRRSGVSSRFSVNTTMYLGYDENMIDLELPVIAAPMDTVCGPEMCIAMHKLGGLGILHRYMSYKDKLTYARDLFYNEYRFGVAVASTSDGIKEAQALYDLGVKIILVDTANGHGTYAVEAVKNIRSIAKDIHIMAGNVATADGFAYLAKAGASSVRVGIGGGAACTTRIVSGHGVPTLTSIMDCESWREQFYASDDVRCSVIADGGIRNSGDMVKAFAAGADAVMVGSMLSGTDESPGKIFVDANGKRVKKFRGMASADAQMDSLGNVSVAEGISTTVPYKGSVVDILDQIRGGIGSGCSYSGAYNLRELSTFAKYVKVSAASLNESRPHAL
jgi:IMP dehydrogenase